MTPGTKVAVLSVGAQLGTQRARLAADAERRRQSAAKVLEPVVRRLIARQRDVTVAKLRSEKARRHTKFWRGPEGRPPIVTKVLAASDVFDTDRWAKEWQDELSGPLTDVAGSTAADVSDELGTPEPSSSEVSALALAVALASAKAVTNTAGRVQTLLDQANADGSDMAVDDIVDALTTGGGVLDVDGSRVGGLADWAAAAVNGGAGILAAGTGGSDGPAVTKLWTSMGDESVRPDHADADGQERPVDEPFDVGGEDLQYPGDPQGSMEQTENCRCWVTFQAADGSTTEDEGDDSGDDSEKALGAMLALERRATRRQLVRAEKRRRALAAMISLEHPGAGR